MTTEAWPTGREAHHHRAGEDAQRDQALAFHADDPHDVEGHYAALREAHSRIAVLERPSAASRLDRLRRTAAARSLRRSAAREANWMAHHGETHPRSRYAALHERWPDRNAAPSTDGFELTAEDIARIGPTAADIDVECDDRIDDMRPRLSELMAFNGARKTTFPGSEDRVSVLLQRRVNDIERNRERAAFLKTLATVADDYFEPHHWTTAKSAALLKHVRESQLGTPESGTDPWHALAAGAMSATSHHDDLLAVCVATAEGRRLAKSVGVWENPPVLPVVTVTRAPHSLTVSHTGTMPENTSLNIIIAVSSNLTPDPALELTVSVNPKTFSVAGDRVAVLTQFIQTTVQPRRKTLRTVGEINYTGQLGN